VGVQKKKGGKVYEFLMNSKARVSCSSSLKKKSGGRPCGRQKEKDELRPTDQTLSAPRKKKIFPLEQEEKKTYAPSGGKGGKN